MNLPVFNRLPLHDRIDEVIGDFTSISLLGVDLDAAGRTFAERASSLAERLYDDLDHRLFTGLDVIAELGRRHGSPPLFPVVFTSTLGSAPGSDSAMGAFRDGVTQTPQVWIDCQIMANGDEGLLTWDIRQGVLPNGMPRPPSGLSPTSSSASLTAMRHGASPTPFGSPHPSSAGGRRSTTPVHPRPSTCSTSPSSHAPRAIPSGWRSSTRTALARTAGCWPRRGASRAPPRGGVPPR